MSKKLGEKPLSYEEFRAIYGKVTRLVVEVVLIKDGKVALAFRDIEPYKGWWHTPGGTVYYKETIEDAVKRVAREELGVEVKVVKSLGYWEIPEWEVPNGFTHSVGLVHQVELVTGEVRANDQSSKVEFFEKIPEKTIKEQREFLVKEMGF